MILARISRAIREQNWFAVVLEFVIVVAGVMLAFYLTNLSERHNSRLDEAATLERLLDETEAAIEYLDRRISTALRGIHQLDRSVRALHEGALNGLDLDAFENGIWNGGRYPALTPPQAVMDELIASGQIGDLRDVSVREALAQYKGSLEFYAQQLPYFRSLAAQPDALGGADFRSAYRPNSPSRRETVANFDALAGNEVFVGEMTGSIYGQIAFLHYRDAVRQNAYQLCIELANAIERPCSAPPFTLEIFENLAEPDE